MKRTFSLNPKMAISTLLLTLSLALLSGKVFAQHHPGHRPGDSTSVGGDTSWPVPPVDTSGWSGDSIHHRPHPPIDTTSWGWGDTIHHPVPPIDTAGWAGDTSHHRPPVDTISWTGDSIHHPHPSVDTIAWGGDTIRWRGGDTSGHNPPAPPAPGDTFVVHGDTIIWVGGDTTILNGDTVVWSGGDTIGHNPPPFPGDSTGSGCDTTHHGKPGLLGGTSDNGPTPAVTVAVYPNPVSASSVINVQNTTGNVTFRLFDGSGKVVRVQTDLTNGSFQLNKDDLAPGLYFYQISDNTSNTSGRIIIQ